MNILLILTAEGLAWGFIGLLMGAETSPWAGAVAVGGTIVLLVGGIDAAFTMLDLSQLRGSNIASSDTSRNWRGKLSAFLRKYGKGARLGVLFRVAMVVASLLITSPFLAQLMFSTDIANMRKADYDQAVAGKTKSIADAYDRTLTSLRDQRDRTAAEYSREIAGTGLSGRYGLGPVARSLESAVHDFDRQLKAVGVEKEAKLANLRDADPASRAHDFGVPVAVDGIATRFNALARMETIPGFTNAENAIRMILFGLFLGLLLLKWYEPRALEIYLDEELQDAFELYRAGAYDHSHDRAKLPPEKMTPFAFHRWYYQSEKLRTKMQEFKDKMAGISSRHDEIESAVRRLSDQPGEDMLALSRARQVRMQDVVAASEHVKKFQDEASALDAEIALCEAELRNATNTIANEPRFSTSVVLLKKQESWEQRQALARTKVRVHAEQLAKAVEVRDAKAAELKHLDDVIAAQNALMAELASAVADARRTALRELRDAG
jgi:hypothetical protein